jgi:hypothetical protein
VCLERVGRFDEKSDCSKSINMAINSDTTVQPYKHAIHKTVPLPTETALPSNLLERFAISVSSTVAPRIVFPSFHTRSPCIV